jgi:hypothetical protein
MARIASFTTAGVPATDPTGGMTLDALMLRQKMLAEQGQKIAEPRDMRSPWQGAAMLAQQFVNQRNENTAEDQLAAGRDALAKVKAGINLETGATPEQLAEIGRYSPDDADKFMSLAAQAIQARRAQEAAIANREDTQTFTHGENELNRQTEMDKATAAAKLAAMPKISDISGVRQDVISDPSYKNMAQAVPIWTSMKDAASRDTPQADLNMIIALAKLFDPTSVVRTQEGEAVKQTGDLPTEIYSQYAYLTGQPGARLSPEIRNGMLQEGWSRVKGYADAYAKTSDFYSNLAKESGIDVNKVVPQFGDATPYVQPDPNQPPAGTPPAAATPPAADSVPSIPADDMAKFRALPPGSQYTVPGHNGPDGKPMVFIKQAPAAPPPAVRQAVPNAGGP